MFTNKVYRHPIKPNKVPKRCWDESSVNLFGPLPSKNHVVVIQDLASRYPIDKLDKSTNAESVIPVLEDVHLEIRSDKKVTTDPRLILRKKKTLLEIEILNWLKHYQGIFPLIETVMKLLGKAMKIGQF